MEVLLFGALVGWGIAHIFYTNATEEAHRAHSRGWMEGYNTRKQQEKEGYDPEED
jgi:hypothetical protein